MSVTSQSNPIFSLLSLILLLTCNLSSSAFNFNDLFSINAVAKHKLSQLLVQDTLPPAAKLNEIITITNQLIAATKRSSITRGKNPRISGGCYKVETFLSAQNKPKWSQYTSAVAAVMGSTIGTRNTLRTNSYQYFSYTDDTFVNLSEYNGDKFYAFTEGTYRYNAACDAFEATVSRINVCVLTFKISINVNGKGNINVLYDDGMFRIVENDAKAKVLQSKQPTIPSYYRDIFI